MKCSKGDGEKMRRSGTIKGRALRAVCGLTLALALAVPAGAAQAAFTDVPAGSWYSQAVEEAVAAGLMSGTSATTFSPDWAVTRGMAVTVLWRLSGALAPAGEGSFTDVPADTWYTQAAAWAQEQGIASGDGRGAFRPESAITREELAVLLYQYALRTDSDTAEGVLELYRDGNTVSSWAKTAMEHAVGAGLITGSGGTLAPKRAATRAELAVVLERLTTPAMG